MRRQIVVFICLVFCFSAHAREDNVERAIEKLAAGLLREHPELAKGMRRSEARTKVGHEIKRISTSKIKGPVKKLLDRRKSAVTEEHWNELLRLYEGAKIKGAKEEFFLKRAKDKHLNNVEQYLLFQMMEYHLELTTEARVDTNKARMRVLGKAFTSFYAQNKKAPASLQELVKDAEILEGIDPATGVTYPWIYTAVDGYEMLGVNRKRVILTTEMPFGRRGDMRLIGYKGGSCGEWKADTIAKKLQEMAAASEKKKLSQQKAQEARKKKQKARKTPIKKTAPSKNKRGAAKKASPTKA